MGQILHRCAKTTEAVRQAIQKSQESINILSKRYNLNPKTISKWKKRSYTSDSPMGPKNPRSTVLSREEEAIIVAFRRHTLLPLDDCLYALQETIPHLSRSSLHRCLKRHGISRLPETGEKRTPKKKFKKYPIGYFHIDIAEVHTEEGRLYLFVAIDRTSKYAYAELHHRATRRVAATFLKTLTEVVPYKIHTVLTDNGLQFTDISRFRNSVQEKEETEKQPPNPHGIYLVHAFEQACEQNNIEHRLTKPAHPWTNGQVERMNRTIKDATVKRYHYKSHKSLKEHLYTFMMAYNHAKRLKTLNGLTSYEYILNCWKKEPERFRINPTHHSLGLNKPLAECLLFRL